MHLCGDFPASKIGDMVCNGKGIKYLLHDFALIINIYLASAVPYSYNFPNNNSCVNWNQYYTNCTQLGQNPFQGTISFDNIGLAWVAIFLVNILESKNRMIYKCLGCTFKMFALGFISWKFIPILGDFIGRMDRYHVLCAGCTQFLGLDLLCLTYCGMWITILFRKCGIQCNFIIIVWSFQWFININKIVLIFTS